VTPEGVLKSAVAITKRWPDDAGALAGAADLISVVSDLGQRPDPLRSHMLSVLDRRYLANPAQFNPDSGPAAREATRELYLQARDGKDLDVERSPAAVALQLYSRALERDGKGLLPALRTRLYLWRLAFDPESARPLLTDLARAQPRNAVVALERARAAFLVDGKPAEGMALCREVHRLPDFSRAYLVGAPGPLRTGLKYARGLDEVLKKGWPGYQWLFTTLQDAQNVQKDAGGQLEILLLRLKIADLLCRAPDYPDQALGIHEKALALAMIAAWGDRLPPEQRVLVEAQREEHRRAFAEFPRRRTMMFLTGDGLLEGYYPRRDPVAISGYHLILAPTGVLFGHGSTRH
jgi:hypothetical protein